MIRVKSFFVCAAYTWLGIVGTPLRAQAPGDPFSDPSKASAEKSLLAEAATKAIKSESTAQDFCQCVGQGDSSAVNRIEQALRAPLHSSGLDYADTPLQDVVTQLQDDYGIPIQLNRRALEEAGIGTDTPVSISLHNISLKSALRLMLKQLQLTTIIQDEVLTITTQGDAESQLKICVYDARKIISDTSEKKLEALSDTILSCIATDTWAENGGGAADIRPLPPGLLVISQTQAVHQQISDLLATIRRMTQNHPSDTNAPATSAPKEKPKPGPG